MKKNILYLYFFSIISVTTWYFSSKFLPLSNNGLSIILSNSHRFLTSSSWYITINLLIPSWYILTKIKPLNPSCLIMKLSKFHRFSTSNSWYITIILQTHFMLMDTMSPIAISIEIFHEIFNVFWQNLNHKIPVAKPWIC